MAHGFPIEVLAGLVRSGLAGAALEAPARLAMMIHPATGVPQKPAAAPGGLDLGCGPNPEVAVPLPCQETGPYCRFLSEPIAGRAEAP